MAPHEQLKTKTMNDTINDEQSTEDGGAVGKPAVMGSPFHGSNFTSVGPVVLGCISPEARELLDTIMEKWEEHLAEIKKAHGPDYTPTHYGFAYWLVRWSGLVRPSDCP